MNVLQRIWAWLRRVFTRESAALRTVVVDDLPEQLSAEEVYLIGENGNFWCVALLCPCRCGDVIQLNLVPGTRPLWAFKLEPGTRSMTLKPSVWRTAGCHSHFILRAGRVQWCERSTARH